MSAPDQWSWWRDALTGKPVESEVGSPRSGFWKAPQDEPIAIWRDDAGNVCCERVRFGGGDRMSLDAIDQLYASASRYPLDEATYDAARRGEPPLGFKTRLTGKECQANVVWSLEMGRKKLGLDASSGEAADGRVAAIKPNRTPEFTEAAGEAPSGPAVDPAPTGHTFAGERTPELILTEEISALGAQVKRWLTEIGGAPRDKAEADIIADYKTKFGALEKRADKARVDEKQPHLDAGRDIDAKWKRPIGDAKSQKDQCGRIGNAWIDAENARRKAAADAANAQAAAAAAKHAKQYDAPVTAPPPVEAERVTGIGNMRTVSQRETTSWVLTDAREYLRHLLTLNTDLPAEIVEAAEKVARRRAETAPGVEKKTGRKAA